MSSHHKKQHQSIEGTGLDSPCETTTWCIHACWGETRYKYCLHQPKDRDSGQDQQIVV